MEDQTAEYASWREQYCSDNVLLYSGGIDSFILYHYLVKNNQKFHCVYFNHGGRYVSNEVERINIMNDNLDLKYPKIVIYNDIDLKKYETSDAHIPNRNILFATMANTMGYKKIWIGGSLSDRVEDNNKNILDDYSKFLSNMNKETIEITSPFWNSYKENMIQWFLRYVFNNPMIIVESTFSCYSPLRAKRDFPIIVENGVEDKIILHTEECMNCAACFRKSAALFSAGVFIPFHNAKIVDKYFEEFRFSIDRSLRVRSTLVYIEKLKKYLLEQEENNK